MNSSAAAVHVWREPALGGVAHDRRDALVLGLHSIQTSTLDARHRRRFPVDRVAVQDDALAEIRVDVHAAQPVTAATLGREATRSRQAARRASADGNLDLVEGVLGDSEVGGSR